MNAPFQYHGIVTVVSTNTQLAKRMIIGGCQLDSEILLRGQFESLKKKKHPVILYPFPSRGSKHFTSKGV